MERVKLQHGGRKRYPPAIGSVHLLRGENHDVLPPGFDVSLQVEYLDSSGVRSKRGSGV